MTEGIHITRAHLHDLLTDAHVALVEHRTEQAGAIIGALRKITAPEVSAPAAAPLIRQMPLEWSHVMQPTPPPFVPVQPQGMMTFGPAPTLAAEEAQPAHAGSVPAGEAAPPVPLRIDLAPECEAALSTLAEVLQRLLQVPECPVDRIEALLGLLTVNGDPLLAARTGEGRAVLEPTERLRQAVAAARAVDVDLFGVEGPHVSNSVGGVATPTVPKPGRDHNDSARVDGNNVPSDDAAQDDRAEPGPEPKLPPAATPAAARETSATKERLEMLAATWCDPGLTVAEIFRRWNALPGKPLKTSTALYGYAKKVGLPTIRPAVAAADAAPLPSPEPTTHTGDRAAPEPPAAPVEPVRRASAHPIPAMLTGDEAVKAEAFEAFEKGLTVRDIAADFGEPIAKLSGWLAEWRLLRKQQGGAA